MGETRAETAGKGVCRKAKSGANSKSGTEEVKRTLLTPSVPVFQGSINHRGHYQSGGVQGMEVHVKDTARFQGGWAFFSFDDGAAPAKQIPVTAACYSCHSAHAAVDTTFVQFYPTLLPVAQQHSTLSAAYLKATAELIEIKGDVAN